MRTRSVAALALTVARLCALAVACGAASHRQEATEATEPEEDSERRLVLEALQTGILTSLGMDRPPVVQEKASQTELRRMRRLYEETLSELGLNTSRTSPMTSELLPERVLQLHPGRRAESRRRHLLWHRAVFVEKPRVQDDLSLIRAELHLSRTALRRASRRVKVHVQNSTRHAAWTDATSDGIASQSVLVDVSREGLQWLRGSRGGPLEVDIGIRGARYKFKVSLKLTLEHKTRTARSVQEADCGAGLCCRHSVGVSFRDIGWTDWVVAPLEYTMHFCQGSCPHNYKPAGMHTQVKSRMAQISKGGTPRPCCVPAEYEPMVLMHYDSRGKLKLTPFQDLIVSSCYCA